MISPTRELATQIFEVFRMAGRYHGMTAGVVTGGKKEFREEQVRWGLGEGIWVSFLTYVCSTNSLSLDVGRRVTLFGVTCLLQPQVVYCSIWSKPQVSTVTT